MEEIRDIAENGVTPAEMEKLQNQLLNDTIRVRQSSMARAQNIAELALYDGDPSLVNTELDDLLAVTGDQIKENVAKYLNTENRTLLDVVTTRKQ
jgi:predicted Zn-dependent peptidase